MTTLEEAKKKYRNGVNAAAREGNYARGVAKFLGEELDDVVRGPTNDAWSELFSEPSAAADKAEVWAGNTKRVHLKRGP